MSRSVFVSGTVTRFHLLLTHSRAVKGRVPLKPDMGITFYQEFQRVNTFLTGKMR